METNLEPLLDKKSTKKIILDLLIEKQPQTLKELYSSIKKQKDISYQATHKAVQDMESEKIIQKNNNKLSINQAWIDGISNTINSIKQKQSEENTTKIYNLDSYSQFAKFIIEQTATLPDENQPSVCAMKHSWPALGLDQSDLLKISKFLKEREYYDATCGNTPLDVSFAKTLEKLGKKVKIGAKIKIDNDFVVQGNTVLKIIFEKKLKNNIHKIFTKHKKLDESAIQEIITKIITEKNNIQVIIYQDKEMAEEMRKKVMREFD